MKTEVEVIETICCPNCNHYALKWGIVGDIFNCDMCGVKIDLEEEGN